MSNFTNRVKEKFLSFNNTEFNDRHRYFFGPLPAMDLDMIEYKNDLPAILFETKHGHTSLIDLDEKNMIRLQNTARLLSIPFFIVVYYFPGLNKYNGLSNEYGEKHKYYLIAGNDLARSYMRYTHEQLMTEKQFVEFIYFIKNQPMPELQLDNAIDTIPDLPMIKGLPRKMKEAI